MRWPLDTVICDAAFNTGNCSALASLDLFRVADFHRVNNDGGRLHHVILQDNFLLVIRLLQGVPSARGLGWVDLNFECSTVCPILPMLMGIRQKQLGS